MEMRTVHTTTYQAYPIHRSDLRSYASLTANNNIPTIITAV